VLTGQHCSHCGQHAKVRVISLWGLVRDLLGDMFDWDSRVWRTLRPLAFRPGLLTREYLLVRRAHYTPPFRMYLILSVIFFLIASIFDPGKDIAFRADEQGTGLVIDEDAAGPDTKRGNATNPATPAAPATTPAPGSDTAQSPPADAGEPDKPPAATGADTTRQAATGRERLIEGIVRHVPETERAEVRAELDKEFGQASPAQLERLSEVIADPCSKENFKLDVDFLKQYEPRLRQACSRIVADQQSFGRALFENLPKMMFIFLPLIALVMAFLYLGSGRYYVEHLLFFVHYHAFFFLAGIAVLLLDWAGERATGAASGLVTAAEGILGTVLFIYVPVYLYLAMRRVYGQGRFWTITKYFALAIAYIVCLALTGVGLLFYTALTL
jgi:hypothetical protein